MLFIVYLLFIRIYYFSEKVLMKYPVYMVYIYLGIIVMNTLVNIIFLVIVDINTTTSLINSTINSFMDINESIIILKISPDNSDLLQGDLKVIDIESNKKIGSVDVDVNNNKNEFEVKIRK